jgi:hypothetical protein
VSTTGNGSTASNSGSQGSNGTTGTTGYCYKPPKTCPDGVTLVIGRGPSCIYDACPSSSLANNTNTGSNYNNTSTSCPNERLVCDNGSTVGRTGPNCSFAACPTTTNSNINTVNGTKRCSDGSTVGMYETCYQTCSNGVRILETQSCSIFGTTSNTNTSTGNLVCARDLYTCSDGSYVSRSGPNCTFSQCPTGGSSTNYCTQEAFICPNGVGVFRSGPNCAFAACPTTTNNGTFKPADTGTNGQTITPTPSPSITTMPAALGVQVPFTNLPNNAPLSALFETVIDLEKTSYIHRSISLEPEQAVTYRIDIPSWFEGAQIRVLSEMGSNGMDVTRMISISDKPGDFDTVKGLMGPSNVAANACFTTLLHPSLVINTSKVGKSIYEYEDGGTLRNNIGKFPFTPAELANRRNFTCIIQPGKTYYINVRVSSQSGSSEFKTIDGCKLARQLSGSTAPCGSIVQIVHDGKIDVLKGLPQ